jgi:hypothetical protein
LKSHSTSPRATVAEIFEPHRPFAFGLNLQQYDRLTIAGNDCAILGDGAGSIRGSFGAGFCTEQRDRRDDGLAVHQPQPASRPGG